MHVNEEFAKTTMFKGRIAHGMIGAAFISAVLGMRCPARLHLREAGPEVQGAGQDRRHAYGARHHQKADPEKKFVECETVCTVATRT